MSEEEEKALQPLSNELTPEQRAYQAYNYQIAGHDWITIAERCGYSSASVAKRAVNTLISSARGSISDETKKETIDKELTRLDSLQSAYYQSALDGDYKATELVLKIMVHRAKLLQLGEEQIASNRTIIITSEEYAERLKEIADE